MTPIRQLLVALLVFALPLQGAIASSRWLCAGTTSHAAAAVHEHRTGHADTAGHAVAYDEPSMKTHGHDATTAAAPVNGTLAVAGDAGCNLCAACSVTAATPPAQLVLAAVDCATEPFTAPQALVPQIAAGGPERPPRTI